MSELLEHMRAESSYLEKNGSILHKCCQRRIQILLGIPKHVGPVLESAVPARAKPWNPTSTLSPNFTHSLPRSLWLQASLFFSWQWQVLSTDRQQARKLLLVKRVQHPFLYIIPRLVFHKDRLPFIVSSPLGRSLPKVRKWLPPFFLTRFRLPNKMPKVCLVNLNLSVNIICRLLSTNV